MTKNVDMKQFEKLCGVFCTEAEICSILDISVETLDRRIKEKYGHEYNFRSIYKRFTAGAKSSLRREQYRVAMKGNERMLIWLGKQHLDQKDKNELGFDPNRPAVFKLNMGKTLDPEKDDDDAAD